MVDKANDDEIFRKHDRVRVKCSGVSGVIVSADNVKKKHLVLLHDTQTKQAYTSEQIEKIG